MPAETQKTVRLQAHLAHCGVASRRACEKIILDGRVRVNGIAVTELGTKVSSGDAVTLDGKEVRRESVRRYVLLNKPAGYVCSQSDEKGRPVAASILSGTFPERLYNVGRLDMFSEGAILFTNDGDFAAKISHPSAEIEKEYVVESRDPIPRDLAARFRDGIRVDGVFYRAKDARDLNSHRMRVVLVEGKNREIRRVFDGAGVKIRSLRRIRIGCVLLGALKSGEFRQLSPDEVSSLLRLCKGTGEEL